jgi:hypothetical protein
MKRASKRIVFSVRLMWVLGLCASGCSLFHHDSPQQSFMNALNRGNGAEASQRWLKMSAKDRSNLSHNIGFKREVNAGDVQRELIKHQKEEAAKNGDDDPDSTIVDGDINSQQIEIPGFDGDPNANGISNLPLLDTLQESAPAPITTIGPQ